MCVTRSTCRTSLDSQCRDKFCIRGGNFVLSWVVFVWVWGNGVGWGMVVVVFVFV